MQEPIEDGMAAENRRLAKRIQALEDSQAESARLVKDLSEREQCFRSLAENSSDMVFRYELRPKPHFSYVNPSALAITGCTPQEHYADPNLSYGLVHPDDLLVLQQIMGGERERAVVRLVKKDGQTVWTQQNCSAIYNDQGEPIAIQGTVHDITGRKAMETEFEQFHRFFLTSADIMVFADPNGAFLKVNPVTTEILGYTESELLAKPFVEFIHPGDKQKTIDEMIEQQRIGSSLNFENRYICKDGSFRWLSWRAIYDDNDKTTYAIARDITELKRADESLRNTQALHKRLEEIARIGGWELDIGTLKQTWTEESYRIHEVALDFEPTAASGIGFFTPESQPVMEVSVRDAIENEVPFDVELEIITAKGNARSLHVIGRPDKENNRVHGFFQDITDRKKAELELRENEATFRNILETSSDAILLQDSTAAFVDCNQAALDLMKMTRDQFIMMTPDQISVEYQPNGRRSEEYAPEMTALGRRGFHRFEWICKDLEGGEFIVEVTLVPIKRKGEDMLHCTWRNITERKNAEAQLRESEEKYRSLVETAQELVWKCDEQGRFSYLNPAWERTLDYRVEEMLGRSLSDFQPDDVAERDKKEFARQMAGESIKEYETIHLAKDGSIRNLLYNAMPMRDTEGNVIGTQGTAIDITERKQIESERERFESQTNQMQRLESLGILAGGIAHDFNNLLAGIYGYTDLARAVTSDRAVTHYLDESMNSMDRAKALTQQLLTFSKGGAPQLRESELGPIIKANASFALAGSEIAYDLELENDLWRVDIDENQIGQVINNLVINANQATPSSGSIHISANNVVLGRNEKMPLAPGKYVRFSIADSGIGIPSNLLTKIFDPFFSTKKEGRGLGLATCYSIIRKHNGCIEAESVEWRGSTFHVFLPAKGLGEDQESAETIAVSHTGSGTILIMDDEASLREILGLYLNEMGYGIIEAESGERALEICNQVVERDESIEAAFFDLTIPGGMGGKELIVAFRQLFPSVPTYVLSGYSDDPVMAEPTEYGFTDSIKKPFILNELAAMLSQHSPKIVPG